MSFGGLGGGSRNRTDQYFVVPKNRARRKNGDTDGWQVTKGPTDRGANTVSNHRKKSAATKKAKKLAKKNDTILTVFDAAKKSSRQFDYR